MSDLVPKLSDLVTIYLPDGTRYRTIATAYSTTDDGAQSVELLVDPEDADQERPRP